MNEQTKLTHKAKWALDQTAKSLKELGEEVERLENALDEQTGVVQELKPYPWEEFRHRKGPNQHHYGTPEHAKREAEEVYNASLALRAENEAIVASNKAVLTRLTQLIKNAGIPESVSFRKPGTRYKWVTEETAWASALKQHIVTNDGWLVVQTAYDSFVRECNSWADQIRKDAAAKEAARWAHELAINQEVVRREMAQRYKTDADCAIRDVLAVIIGRNKYLRLAHYLEANRGDWTDGPDYAEMGLQGFAVETDQDKQIAADIGGHISDWCGDGRIFRDCTWNYSRLFEIAAEQDAQLVADYRRVKEVLP